MEAKSGEEALSILSDKQFDLVLLDVEMPIMSGDAVLIKIRQAKGHEELPVVMVSSKSQDSIIVNCFKAGANDYITKPINFEIALTRILNHLKLAEAIKDRVKLQELAALNAMVTTYNHEINNPLTIALGGMAKLEKDRNDDLSIKRIKDALDRITDIVKKITLATNKSEVNYEVYSGAFKMLKLR